ncbi:MAG: EAL domain-containing protein, partial [Roseburia sp.]|nr:EAL domain-containing protein [Roseburia sp.]
MIQRGRSDIIISVNVSKVQFMTPNFENRVMETVQSYQINPKNISLEIAENTLMENYEYISKIIMRLRQFGFTVAMDDFGKELSSMESLTTSSFEYVKLDMLFFKNKLATEKDRVVVKNILRMLLNLNYKLICEGVSDEKTLTELAQICRDVIVQGYVISEPIPLPMFDPFADRVFNFNLPEFEEEEEEEKTPKKKKSKDEGKDASVDVNVDANLGTPNGGTSINISGLGGTTVVPEQNKEMEEMRRQMEEMRRQFQSTLEEQKRQAHEDEMKRMRDEMARMQNQPKEKDHSSEYDALRLEIERLKASQNTSTNTYIQREYRDRNYYDYEDEISRLRREVSDLRYADRGRDRYFVRDTRDRDYELLQKQIDDLKENQRNQPVFNIDELVERLTKRQDDSRYRIEKAEAEAKSLRERLEQERKEREDLEALINELKLKQIEDEQEETVVVDAQEQIREQEEADRNLNLDISTLSRTDVADDEEDEDDEEEMEHLVKPKLSLEELEAIIQSYRDKYQDEWSTYAKDELRDGYYEIIDGLNYYRRTRRTFLDRIKKASPELKQVFNIVKNEIMKYSNVSNKLTNFYDSFYIGRKLVCKLSLTSKKLKVYLAMDPSKYPERQFPHRDVSDKKAHVRTPYYTMVRSQLSVRRINKVIDDLMEEHKSVVNSNYKSVDYANKFKYIKAEKQ